MQKKYLVFIVVTIISLTGAFYLYKNFFIKSKADLRVSLKTEGISKDSAYSLSDSSLIYDIYSTSSYIYKTKEKNELGIIEFIQSKPEYQISTDKNEVLIPENFLANSVLLKKELDQNDISIKKINPDLNGVHYYYNQEINGIPIYGAVFGIHLKNENEVYAVTANLTKDKVVDDQKITEDNAKNIALEEAKKEVRDISLNLEETQKYIFNQGLLGLSSDFKNYNTLAVTVRSDKEDGAYGKTFFIDLSSGRIIYQKELIQDALSRTMKDCSSSVSCRTVRTEGSAATGDTDTDTAYENIGDTYNFYFNKFKRNSYDNAGAPYIGNVHVPSNGSVVCPNAFWDGESMNMCSGMAIKDVTAHELTHAVTQSALRGNGVYESQAGSINESFSDIFGWGVDDANWTMGEGSAIGVIRRIDDPTKSRTPQPDKIFSSNYYCGSPCTRQTDYCGVHQNNGVLNKAFYLMVEGGDFNGCKMIGVGEEKSLNIAYRVQNTYLQPRSNYRSLYTAFQQACSDLYPSETDTCNEVKKAFQAVEMDQQTQNTLTGAKCTGATEQTASCVGSQAGPTNTPTPSSGVPPTATPTSAGSLNPTLSPTISTTPNPTSSVTVSPTTQPASGINLSLKLKFQGITSKPLDQYNKMTVKVRLVSKNNEIYDSVADFTADAGGVWQGKLLFNSAKEADYSIFVKGPKHIQKKFCDSAPTESNVGSYRCNDPNKSIHLISGDSSFDFSSAVLLVGDLDPQDGLVNSYDFSVIRNNLSSRDSEILRKADLNLDGIIDTQDYSLIIQALSKRYDEEN